jgi:glycosyltransferase involved in cell wall biosynthesis
VKDQATLLRALLSVHEWVPGATLDIIGQGPLRNNLERLTHELGIQHAVSFHGNVAHDALPNMYRLGDAFVVSSRHEAQSMVAVEAAACGVPIVGTCVGVVPELAGSGAVVPVGDAKALATALVAACDQSRTIKRAADHYVQTEFGLEPCIARFRALYAQL